MDLKYERKLIKQGYKVIVGVDEAGRGAWAGPIVAGATMIFNTKSKIPKFVYNIKDSKQLSSKKREELFELIKINFIWSVGVVNAKEIDNIGMTKANKLAMRRAVKNLSYKPDYLLIDYIKDIGLDITTEGIKGGDTKILSIAAASIVAKVYRDCLMKKIHQTVSDWGFDKHKGYGTSLHRQHLIDNGVSKHHRLSFAPIQKHVT